MANEHFDLAVVVDSDGDGRARIIADTMHAAEILLRRWPSDRRGRDYRAAVEACLDALEGRAGGTSARRAFAKAAKSAGILTAEAMPLAVDPGGYFAGNRPTARRQSGPSNDIEPRPMRRTS
jgi:hypothetical protein